MASFENIHYGREGLAPYACHSRNSRGRLFVEPISPTRTPFQRDRDRIIHSTAFRRLKHKTQVFVHHVGDHYRTRLTHSIEVSQIARSLARALQVDEDLAESLALSHDFGHTPFGHAGEDALDEVLKEHGGFDHNAQSLRIVTKLEQQYAQFDGLNLSWETLEGLVKHNGPVVGEDVPQTILNFDKKFDLELNSYSSIEAQCAAIADDIAYNSHDIDDGLRADMFNLKDLEQLPITSEGLEIVRRQYPDLDPKRTRHEIIRRQITSMVEDVIITAQTNLKDIKPISAAEVRKCGRQIVGFSDQMAVKEKQIKQFLFTKMYRAPQMMVMRDGATKIITDLYNIYLNETNSVPSSLEMRLTSGSNGDKPRLIGDFIASMTDAYAIKEHERLFKETPDLG